jgi:hypothetical protein
MSRLLAGLRRLSASVRDFGMPYRSTDRRRAVIANVPDAYHLDRIVVQHKRIITGDGQMLTELTLTPKPPAKPQRLR